MGNDCLYGKVDSKGLRRLNTIVIGGSVSVEAGGSGRR